MIQRHTAEEQPAMPEKNTLEDEVREVLRNLDENPAPPGGEQTGTEDSPGHGLLTGAADPLETFHIYPMGNGLFITKEELTKEELAGETLSEGITIPETAEPASTPPPTPPRKFQMNMWAVSTILLLCVLAGENI